MPHDKTALMFIMRHSQGFDPTANNIAHAFHLLGLHPEIQAKVHEEIDLVCGEDWYKPVMNDELKELTYMECVLKVTYCTAIALTLLFTILGSNM
ncbi:hypothetical protein HPB48_022899 [Haemaphysalis longicornis]|uniref:Cytochrome P450 n=1 Tax=Haemaphysalis longicornis TaxID=44386 RepID=A0A9J6GB89_HAELO|nr:hypothetical protein HPB48_022899 [Haemaphysalis longicornis]